MPLCPFSLLGTILTPDKKNYRAENTPIHHACYLNYIEQFILPSLKRRRLPALGSVNAGLSLKNRSKRLKSQA